MSNLLPWGPWHPDREQVDRSNLVLSAKGVRPVVSGYAPIGQLSAGSDALASTPLDGVSFLDSDGNVVSFVGTATALYKLT